MNSTDKELLKEYREEAEGNALLVEFDENGLVKDLPQFAGISGLAKVTLSSNQHRIFQNLCKGIEQQVTKENMVAWAGTGGSDTTRLRAMAFPSQQKLDELNASGVEIRDPYKTGMDAKNDHMANKKACIVLDQDTWNEQAKNAVETLITSLKMALPEQEYTLDMRQLVAIQPNLHNGAPFLKAHMDFPLHDGFGKTIVTVAVSGSATILLYGPYDEDKQDHEGVWRFRLEQGECYCMSGLARTNCLHAVYAEGEEDRTSLNLRFGLYSRDELNNEEWCEDPLV